MMVYSGGCVDVSVIVQLKSDLFYSGRASCSAQAVATAELGPSFPAIVAQPPFSIKDLRSQDVDAFEFGQFCRRICLVLEALDADRRQGGNDGGLGALFAHPLGSAAECPSELRKANYGYGRRAEYRSPAEWFELLKSFHFGA
jgi:hypothetical protein